MPVSEHDLRDLLRERSTVVPITSDLAHRVQQRVRRRRRLEAGVGITALVMVLVAAGLVVLPRRDAAPPVTTTATHRTTQVLGLSLVATTEGPTRIEGETPFELTLEVVNTGTVPWVGMVGAGIVTDSDIPGLFGENRVITVLDGTGSSNFSTQSPKAIADQASPEQLQGAGSETLTLAPGENRTWTWTMKRVARSTVLGDVLGWIPWAHSKNPGSEQLTGSLASAVPIDVTPRASDRPCDTVTITSASVGPTGPWRVTTAKTAELGKDLTARWTDVEVPDAPTFEVTNDRDARDGAVVAAIGRYFDATGILGPTPTAYGPQTYADDATEGAPGRYVAYSGTRMTDVRYTGTCGPSGQTVTGTWTAYGTDAAGILLCGRTVDAGSLGADASRFCTP